MTIYEKLFNIQGLSVKKDATNPFFKCKYATLDNIIEVLNPILKKNKLVVYHKSFDGYLITVLQDTESKDSIESGIKLPDINDPQKLGSAITYFKRYNLGQIFNIVTDEDDDGNAIQKPVNKITEAVVQKITEEKSENCYKCGAEMILNPKTGKKFCKDKCWL